MGGGLKGLVSLIFGFVGKGEIKKYDFMRFLRKTGYKNTVRKPAKVESYQMS